MISKAVRAGSHRNINDKTVLTFERPMFPSCRKLSLYLLCKSVDYFLYNGRKCITESFKEQGEMNLISSVFKWKLFL